MNRRPFFSVGCAIASLALISGAAAAAAPAGASPSSGAALGSASQSAIGRPSTFVATSPRRVLDTSQFAVQYQPRAYGTVHLLVLGRGLVPATGVSSVALTVTVTRPQAQGYLTAYPDGSARPVASNVNFRPAQRTSNLVVVAVGANGRVALYNGSAGTVQMVADVSGHYASDTANRAGSFVATTPTRVLDTRTGLGAATPAGGGTVRLPVLGRGPVPSTAVSSVLVNVTVIAPATGGSLTVYGDGTSRPAHPNVFFVAGQTVPILVVAPVGANGKIAIVNGSSGPVRLVADVFGYHLAKEAVRTGTFVPLPPTRLGSSGAIGPFDMRSVVSVNDRPDSEPVPPAGVAAVVMNVTVSDPSAAGALSFTDQQGATQSVAFGKGQRVSSLVVGKLAGGNLYAYNASSGYTTFDYDVVGYYLAGPGRGALAGTVTGTGGVGVPGVRVIAYDGGASEYDVEFGSALTAADGTYRIAQLWAGMTYLVCFDASQVDTGDDSTMYPSECYLNRPWVPEMPSSIPTDAERVTVLPSTTTTGVDAGLVAVGAGSISGTVTAADGAPLNLVRVRAFVGSTSYDLAPTGYTHQDGSYLISRLPVASYTVCFGGPAAEFGAINQCYRNIPWDSTPGDSLPAGTTPVVIHAGSNATGIDAQVPA
jgi:hypothetical protein